MSPAPGAERLKVVLDTNVYISAFQFPKGRNAVLWRAARDRRQRVAEIDGSDDRNAVPTSLYPPVAN